MTKQSVSGHSAHFLNILAIFRGLLIYCDTFFSKKIPSPNAVKRPQKGIYMVNKIKINTYLSVINYSLSTTYFSLNEFQNGLPSLRYQNNSII